MRPVSGCRHEGSRGQSKFVAAVVEGNRLHSIAVDCRRDRQDVIQPCLGTGDVGALAAGAREARVAVGGGAPTLPWGPVERRYSIPTQIPPCFLHHIVR